MRGVSKKRKNKVMEESENEYGLLKKQTGHCEMRKLLHITSVNTIQKARNDSKMATVN